MEILITANNNFLQMPKSNTFSTQKRYNIGTTFCGFIWFDVKWYGLTCVENQSFQFKTN